MALRNRWHRIPNYIGRTVRWPFLPRLDFPLIVAGLGRCGTSLVFDTIRKSVRNPYCFARRLDAIDLTGNPVIKTHDYPPEGGLPPGTRAIFMYGNITDTIISTTTQINRWGSMHFDHLRSPYDFAGYTELYSADLLALEDMFAAWYRPQAFPLLCLRYETLYSEASQTALSDFLGYHPPFPPYRPRSTDQSSHPHTSTILETYRELDKKLRAAENFRYLPPRS